MEIMKIKPLGAVYDYYCLINEVPVAEDYISVIQKYEKDVLDLRK